MSDIKHFLKIESKTENVFNAITQQKGLASWWTSDADGTSELNSVLRFFGESALTDYTLKMKVTDLNKPKWVEWRCIKGSKDWLHTHISFALKANGDATNLAFLHSGWAEANEIFALCSFDWAIYLSALREYVETGKAQVGHNNLRLAVRRQ